MEHAHKFELDALKRDWIDAASGDFFLQTVEHCIAKIEAASVVAMDQGVLIAESDPVRFGAAFFAAVYLQVPVILGNPKWQETEWDQFSRQINPALVFGAVDFPESKTLVAMSPERGTILIPTGGSSGRLKFAVHTWDTLTVACNGFCSFAGLGPIHFCCALPLYHVSGLMQVMRSFVSGGSIIFTDYKTIQQGLFPKITASELCLSLVPTQLKRLVEQETTIHWLRDLKAIFLCGASMSANLRSLVRKYQLPVSPTYGMTETAAMITALSASDFLAGNDSVLDKLASLNIPETRVSHWIC